jgi:hypothetical protein
VRTKSPKVEMIEALYKPFPTGKDTGMINELLIYFYQTCNPPPKVERKPQQMIIFSKVEKGFRLFHSELLFLSDFIFHHYDAIKSTRNVVILYLQIG